jgi:hypothetical protein
MAITLRRRCNDWIFGTRSPTRRYSRIGVERSGVDAKTETKVERDNGHKNVI